MLILLRVLRYPPILTICYLITGWASTCAGWKRHPAPPLQKSLPEPTGAPRRARTRTRLPAALRLHRRLLLRVVAGLRRRRRGGKGERREKRARGRPALPRYGRRSGATRSYTQRNPWLTNITMTVGSTACTVQSVPSMLSCV